VKVRNQLLLRSHPRLDSALRIGLLLRVAEGGKSETEGERERKMKGRKERETKKERVEARAMRLFAAAQPSVGDRGWSYVRSWG